MRNDRFLEFSIHPSKKKKEKTHKPTTTKNKQTKEKNTYKKQNIKIHTATI